MSRKIGFAAFHAATLAAVFGCSHAGFAQEATPTPAPTQIAPPSAETPLTLDQALNRAPLDPGEFALAVGADRLPLPADAQPLDALTGVAGIAGDFGQVAHRFGPLLAVASPTMIVLNTNLPPPQIYDGMPTGDAVKFLAATLTPGQWSALTSPQGLGFAELSGPDQQSLFRACVGAQTLRVRPNAGGNLQTVDMTTELPQARLRLGSHTVVELPYSEHSWGGGGSDTPPVGPPSYTLARSLQSDAATLGGSVVKNGSVIQSEISNKPKPGNLDFAVPALRAAVPLGGLKTVDDLVSRISALTKVEIYADPHYAARSVTAVAGVSGKTDAAGRVVPLPSAGDLLRALAFCLTATYRQVGPAYVLTDNLAGVGVSRLLFAEQDVLAERLRQGPLGDAGDIITAQHGIGDLHAYETGADLAITPEEVLKNQGSMGSDIPGSMLQLSFADLTPAQQAFARANLAQAVAHRATNLPSLEGTLLVQTHPTLELLVPSVPGPIDISDGEITGLFRRSQKTLQAESEARSKAEAAKREAAIANPPAVAPVAVQTPPAAPVPPPPSLAQEFTNIPRRAALVNARTPADVDAAVAAMKALGLNQLWLPVFTEGKARIAGTAFSTAEGPDLLAEAHRATVGTDIAVYAVLDLLTWGPDAPADAQDLTVRGDNSTQVTLRQYQRSQDDTAVHTPLTLGPSQKRLVVSPFAPDVQNSLRSLIETVGAEPGLDGIVWRETAPAGYASIRDAGIDTFGYSVEGRLAFLRRAHIDPIDIDTGGNMSGSLPNWDGSVPDEQTAWRRFRMEGDAHLLQTLLSAWPALVPNAGPRPVLVQQRRSSWNADWFGSWDSPQSPLPAYHSPGEQQPGDPAYPTEPGRQAKMQSKVVLVRVDPWAASSPASLASWLNDHLKDRVKAPWDGFVIEFGSGDGPDLQALQYLAGMPAGQTR